MFGQLDFKLVVEPSDSSSFTVVLLAPSRQEKAAWTSDISQVLHKSCKYTKNKDLQITRACLRWALRWLSKHRLWCSSPGPSSAQCLSTS